jgi:hypothetical protein
MYAKVGGVRWKFVDESLKQSFQFAEKIIRLHLKRPLRVFQQAFCTVCQLT